MLLAFEVSGGKWLLTLESGVVNTEVEMSWSICVESTSCGSFKKRY